jgi:hypothetical protein
MNTFTGIRVSLVSFFLLALGVVSPVWSDPMTVVLPQFKAAANGQNAHSRTSLLTDQSFVNLEIRELGRNAAGMVEVEYIVTLENVTATTRPDNPGRELVLYLPAGVEVEPGAVSATLGSVNVVALEGQPTRVEWDVELAGAAPKSAKSKRGWAKDGSTTTSSGTVTVRITIPDLPIQGSALTFE